MADELRLGVARVWREGAGLAWYAGEVATADVLALFAPETALALEELAAYDAAGAWVDCAGLAAPPTSVAAGLALLGELDLIDVSVTLGAGVTLRSHDDGEVTVASPEAEAALALLGALLAQKGFTSAPIIAELLRAPGQYVALAPPDKVLGRYQDFAAYLAAHEERG